MAVGSLTAVEDALPGIATVPELLQAAPAPEAMQVGDAPLVDPADVPPPGAARVEVVRADVEDVVGIATKALLLPGPTRRRVGCCVASLTSKVPPPPCPAAASRRVAAALEQTLQTHAQSGPWAYPRRPRSLLDSRLQRVLEPRLQQLARGQHGWIDHANGRPWWSGTRALDIAAAAGGGRAVGKAVAAVTVA